MTPEEMAEAVEDLREFQTREPRMLGGSLVARCSLDIECPSCGAEYRVPDPLEIIADFTERKLIERAVKYCRWEYGVPRWSAVGDAFSVGSTSAIALCHAVGEDPHEVKEENAEFSQPRDEY